jgi:predicted PilT family ATPase
VTRRLMMFAILSLLLAGTRPALAHGDFRIIGKITKITETTLEVKQTKDEKVVSMVMNKAVAVTRDGKSVNASELKTGLNVAVQAHGDSLDELEIVEIKILPPAKQ